MDLDNPDDLDPLAASVQEELSINHQAMVLIIKKARQWQTHRTLSIEKQERLLSEAVHTLRDGPDTLGRTTALSRCLLRERQRYADFTDECGWMLLSICAHSSAFRHACSDSSDAVWEAFQTTVKVNAQSIEMFIKVRGLDWRTPLSHDTADLGTVGPPNLQESLYVPQDHPHQWLLTKDGTVRRLMHQGRFQENIDECIFDPRKWGRTSCPDPTRHQSADGLCAICSSVDPCTCCYSDFSEPLVELREYPGQGAGVRALSPTSKGSILAQYVGEILPQDHCYTRLEYALRLDSKRGNGRPGAGTMAMISPKRYGNWIRFLNHSCEHSNNFVSMAIDRSIMMVVKAIGTSRSLRRSRPSTEKTGSKWHRSSVGNVDATHPDASRELKGWTRAELGIGIHRLMIERQASRFRAKNGVMEGAPRVRRGRQEYKAINEDEGGVSSASVFFSNYSIAQSRLVLQIFGVSLHSKP